MLIGTIVNLIFMAMLYDETQYVVKHEGFGPDLTAITELDEYGGGKPQ